MPVVHLHLRISPQIFGKNLKKTNDPHVIFGGLWQNDSWKKPEAKNLETLSLYLAGPNTFCSQFCLILTTFAASVYHRVLRGPRSSSIFWLPRNFSNPMDRQARTRDPVLGVERWPNTAIVAGRRDKDDRKQNALGPVGRYSLCRYCIYYISKIQNGWQDSKILIGGGGGGVWRLWVILLM